MPAEALTIFYYTFIHIVPFDLLLFYLFRRQLRLTPLRTAAGYGLLVIAEWGIQLTVTGGGYDQCISLIFQVIYAAYDMWAIRDYPLKVLALDILTIPLELFAYSIASLAETSWPLGSPYLTNSLAITVMALLVYRPVLHYIRQNLTDCLSIKEPAPWNCLFSYECILIILTLFIDPLSENASPRVFLARFCLLAANVFSIRILLYLCHSIQAREYTHHLLNSLQSLQQMEHRRYELVMDAWYASRRMRHDLKHHLLTIESLLDAHDYPGLRNYLDKTVQAFTHDKD